MPVTREYPIRFTPRGISDAFDSTDVFVGACRTLQNLILDQTNPELVIARPGVGTAIANLVGFNSVWGGTFSWGQPGLVWGSFVFLGPTVITVHISIGNTIYGMVSSALNPGRDEPFIYQIGFGFIAITGVTAANTPLSPSSFGDWTPPTMAVIGSKLIVTHPGFTLPIAFGVMDISVPTAPTWTAQNTTGFPLPAVPAAVVNFNNRAYYAIGNQAFYSDVLAPTVMTSAGQALTVGDTTPIIGFSGLPISTTSSGVVAALIAFKQFQIWQITGDAAITGSLSQNFLSLTVGCLSPRSIVQTPIGIIFIGIDGPYTVSPMAGVGPLTKDGSTLNADVQIPFQTITTPSRAAGSFSGSVYRVCLDTITNGNPTTNDYWFDITRRRWTGPHTFAYDCASQIANYFILSYRFSGPALFKSEYIPSASSTYTDNGLPITTILESSSLPKTPNINMKQVVESTIETSSIASNLTYFILALNDQRGIINATQLTVNNPNNLWGGGGLWGSGLLWASSYNSPSTKTINWTAPLVFKKLAILITAESTSDLSIGTFFAKYQDTGYTNQQIGS